MADPGPGPLTINVVLTSAQAELLGLFCRFVRVEPEGADMATVRQLEALGLVEYDKYLSSQSGRSLALWHTTVKGEQAWDQHQLSAART